MQGLPHGWWSAEGNPARDQKGTATPTVQLTDDNFGELTRDVVTDFWADWCGPCHAFAPVFADAADRHPGIVFAKVDVEANPLLAERFAVRSIPTLVALRDDTTLVQLAAALPSSELDRLVQELFVDGEARADSAAQTA
ncbi:MAG: thioredoxin family protein [Egibacteraceae bacterium]